MRVSPWGRSCPAGHIATDACRLPDVPCLVRGADRERVVTGASPAKTAGSRTRNTPRHRACRRTWHRLVGREPDLRAVGRDRGARRLRDRHGRRLVSGSGAVTDRLPFRLRLGLSFGVVIVGAGVVSTSARCRFREWSSRWSVRSPWGRGFGRESLGTAVIVGSVEGATISSLVVTSTLASVVAAAAAGWVHRLARAERRERAAAAERDDRCDNGDGSLRSPRRRLPPRRSRRCSASSRRSTAARASSVSRQPGEGVR